MAAQRKLTDEQIQWACSVARKRADLERQLAQLPTVADMAEGLGCTNRYLAEVLSGRTSRNSAKILITRCEKPLNEEQLKQRVRATTLRAVMSGKLRRLPCQQCGALSAEMHHPDYSRPLEVVWLCHPCYMALHKHQTE